jgi:hypothetical protein
MGCGGSKGVLEEIEKPICTIMDKTELNHVDEIFSNSIEILIKIESKRKFLIDDLIDHYFHTGAWAFYSPDPLKAFDCCIWKLGIDNKNNSFQIGFNSKDYCFEGGANSENGNKIANDYLNYMKIIPDMYKEDEMKNFIEQLSEKIELIEENMVTHIKDIGKNYEENPIKGFRFCKILRLNLNILKNGVKIAKELWNIHNTLVKFSSKILSNCSTEFFNSHYGKIYMASRYKQFENLQIAWIIIQTNLRRKLNYEDAVKEYSIKINARKQYLNKSSENYFKILNI